MSEEHRRLDKFDRWLRTVTRLNTIFAAFVLGFAIATLFFVFGLLTWGPCK